MEHHLYVCTKDNQELHRHLTFRNYLRSHPEVARDYEQLKMYLAQNAKFRLDYTEAKSDFINKILKSANYNV
ncbi:MAG: GrpB family protein [Paenisporosarcina sp.]